MNIVNIVQISIKALLRNKLRAMLTMLGVIIGVGSVVAMLAIGEGSKISIQDEISQMGTNLIFIRPGDDIHRGIRMSSDAMQTLLLSDVEAIEKNCTAVSKVSPVVSTNIQGIHGNKNWPVTIYGVNSNYLDIKKYKVKDGRNFNEKDIRRYAKICLIGQTVAENLFEDSENPIGQSIRFGKTPFTILGILQEKGENGMGQDQDDIVLAPYTTVQKRMLAITYIHSIFSSAESEEKNTQAINEITEILRKTHNIKTGDNDDFTVRSQTEMIQTFTSVSDMLTTLLAVVAGISLLVGGIGIMNIMYVSVTERTREIGLRLSVGAKEKHILIQFLIESVLLSATGGLLGILLGVGTSKAASSLLHWQATVTLSSILISFTVCTFIGVFFGWHPARKAAKLNPIDALRYE